jgi:hypothetical protein
VGHPCLSVFTKMEELLTTSFSARIRTTILKTSLRYLKQKVQPLNLIIVKIRDIKTLNGLFSSYIEYDHKTSLKYRGNSFTEIHFLFSNCLLIFRVVRNRLFNFII